MIHATLISWNDNKGNSRIEIVADKNMYPYIALQDFLDRSLTTDVSNINKKDLGIICKTLISEYGVKKSELAKAVGNFDRSDIPNYNNMDDSSPFPEIVPTAPAQPEGFTEFEIKFKEWLSMNSDNRINGKTYTENRVIEEDNPRPKMVTVKKDSCSIM
jgi:hypothetical protein